MRIEMQFREQLPHKDDDIDALKKKAFEEVGDDEARKIMVESFLKKIAREAGAERGAQLADSLSGTPEHSPHDWEKRQRAKTQEYLNLLKVAGLTTETTTALIEKLHGALGVRKTESS